MIISSSIEALDKVYEIIRITTKKEPVEDIIIVGTQNVIRELGKKLSKELFFDKKKT